MAIEIKVGPLSVKNGAQQLENASAYVENILAQQFADLGYDQDHVAAITTNYQPGSVVEIQLIPTGLDEASIETRRIIAQKMFELRQDALSKKMAPDTDVILTARDGRFSHVWRGPASAVSPYHTDAK